MSQSVTAGGAIKFVELRLCFPPSSLFAVNETQGVTKQPPVRFLISRSEANSLSGHLEVKNQPSGLQCVSLWWRRFGDTADHR